MAGLNRITLIGNLGRDPEVRYTPDGLAVTNFSIAVTEKYKGEERTMWFRIVAFGKTGEIAGEYLSKGKQVYVDGRLQTNEWVDREGKNRFTLEVVASNLVLLGAKGESYDASGASSGSSSYETPRSSSPAATPKVSDGPGGGADAGPSDAGPGEDDIPF